MNEDKEYRTSDNCIYYIKRDNSIEDVIKHCAENNLTLFDIEENKFIDLKIKKSKSNGSADS